MNAQKIALITDSGTDTNPEVCKRYNICVLPLRINYSDGSSYEAGVDITTEEVVSRLAQEIPTTSLPSPQRIQAALEDARREGYESAVIVTISGMLSATNHTAQLVASQMENFPTLVIDTKSIGMVAGMIVERAGQLIDEGVPFGELEARLNTVIEQSHIYFAVKSLEYLYKGGRINGHVYRIGSVLNIKPVLTCDEEGKYVIAKKARGWDRALDAMVAAAKADAQKYRSVRLSICCSEATSDLYNVLEERLKAEVLNATEILREPLSADLLVHTGPELVGIGVQNASY